MRACVTGRAISDRAGNVALAHHRAVRRALQPPAVTAPVVDQLEPRLLGEQSIAGGWGLLGPRCHWRRMVLHLESVVSAAAARTARPSAGQVSDRRLQTLDRHTVAAIWHGIGVPNRATQELGIKGVQPRPHGRKTTIPRRKSRPFWELSGRTSLMKQAKPATDCLRPEKAKTR